MSASLRFLAMAVVVWTGVRAATLGALPGTEAFTLGRVMPVDPPAAADMPAIVPTEFAGLETIERSPGRAGCARTWS